MDETADIPGADRAVDRFRSPKAKERIITLRRILMDNTGAGKELLRRIASDPTETDEMLMLAGQQFARLMWADAIS